MITLLTLIPVLRRLDELNQLNNLLIYNELKSKTQKMYGKKTLN